MIRRVIGFFGVLVVGTMLTLSAAPAGASGLSATSSGESSSTVAGAATGRAKYVYTIIGHNCPAFNKASIRVRQRENGVSGTNYFQQKGQVQVFRNGAWRGRGNVFTQRSRQFANNNTSFVYTPGGIVGTWNSEFNFHHRIFVRLQWWNNNGTPNNFRDDRLVATGAAWNQCT